MNKLFLVFLFVAGLQAAAQNIAVANDTSVANAGYHQDLSTKNLKARQWLIGGISVAGYGGSLVFLNEAWYKDYPKSGLHAFNDYKEWLQMDKVGHAWTAYNTSRATTAFWKWAGLPNNKAVWIGSLSGFTYMTVIELLDGYSAEWGWSWSDMAANFTGSSIFVAQELLWREQRIQYKFSSHRNSYAPDLKPRADELFGKTIQERLLKDYNGQSYWLSFNLKSFLPNTNLPKWLNLSVGCGAEGMFGGTKNIGFDKDGNISFYRPDIKRYRQWYLSPDIDLTKIKTSKKGVRFLLGVLNAIKIPAPAIEFSNGKVKGRWIVF